MAFPVVPPSGQTLYFNSIQFNSIQIISFVPGGQLKAGQVVAHRHKHLLCRVGLESSCHNNFNKM